MERRIPWFAGPINLSKSLVRARLLLGTCDRHEAESAPGGRSRHTTNPPHQGTPGQHWTRAMAMSAHFFTSLHPCFKESGTCDGVGKQGLVRHSQSPLRPVFESHDSQYIDRKTRRSPSRWSHSLTLPRAPRTVRTAVYMTCFIFTGVSSKPHVRVGHFLFLADKKSEFTKRNFGCEFGICFLPNKKKSLRWEKSSPCLVSGPPKNHPNRPA